MYSIQTQHSAWSQRRNNHDAQDIIELIEYFRNLQDNEMKFEIEELRGYIDIRFEELYDKLTEYIDSNHPL